VVTACWQHGSVVRLVTTDGVDSGFGSGAGHLERVLARLAVLEPTDDDPATGEAAAGGADGDRQADGGRRTGGLRSLDPLGPGRAVDGAVAVITTTAVGPADLDRLARLGRMPSAITLVAFEARRSRSDDVRWPAIGHVVTVGANQAFAPAWDAVLSLGGAGRGTLVPRRPATR
jgi:hypothetical protein